MLFDYINNFKSDPQVCHIETFKSLTNSPFVKECIEKFRNGDAEAKKRLPAFTFHATFNGRKRIVKNALPSGMIMIDFDHVADEDILKMRDLLKDGGHEDWGVRICHVTPSGKGIRVVIKALKNHIYSECKSIRDFQQRFAHVIDMSKYLDEVTVDLARLSFCPTAEDIIYFNSCLFGESAEVTQFAESQPKLEEPEVELPLEDSGQEMYEGLNLTDIAQAYFTLIGGLPQEGNRNAAFYSASRDLRYICDFNPQVLARILPKVGLSAHELLQVAKSACLSSRASKIPQAVEDAIALVKSMEDEEEEPTASKEQIQLPAIIRPIVKIAPDGFEDATILALLPVLGTLATGVRGRYLDGELHSPSLSTIITAEQASGKSFTRRIVDLLMSDIKEEDNASRVIEQAYKVDLKKKKNSKEQPEDPRVVIRIIPASVSVAKLLQRLDYAGGKHLFSFAEELDTVIKSNQSGAWSQKSDIYRNAFDNAEYGQDFMSDNSYSANLPVFYNTLFLGTPRQTQKFFKDVENGLVSRTCFARLPDGFGQKMPVMKKLSEVDRVKLEKQIKMLRAVNGEVEMKFLFPAIEEWLETERIKSLKESNRARDIFRKRAAVIGFRAALCLRPLYTSSGKNLDRLKQFALYVANLVLEGQLEFAGRRLNEIIDSGSELTKRSDVLFDKLSDEFNMNDVITLCKKMGIKTPSRGLIYTWNKNNLIEKTSPHNYKKIKKHGN